MMRPDVTVLVCHTRPAAGAFISPSETRAQGSGCLADFVDPVEGVGAVAVLDADQLFAQAHGHRARLAVRDYELRGLALDPPHRGDHGRGPAGEHFGQLAG